ncbi:MAG: hypothetical protein KC766_09915 [Myxococcales bacterium]|nr:hypothetical protein [Myxococcales bacterium]
MRRTSLALAEYVARGEKSPDDLDISRLETGIDALVAALRSDDTTLSDLRRLLDVFHEDIELEWLECSGYKTWVVRASGARQLYPLVDLLHVGMTARGLEVVPRLPALPHAEALRWASDCLGRDFSDTRVRVGFVRGHLLELAFAVPGCFGHDDEEAMQAAIVYAECVLGEERFDEWVGSVGVSPAPRSGGLRVVGSVGQVSAATPLRELLPLVEIGIFKLCEGLPDEPLAGSEASDWTLLDGEPLRDETGAPSLLAMDDVVMASTRCPELLKCFLEGLPVSSRRFSRVGERFVYLKLPSSLPLAERPAARARLEEALEPHLGELGVIVGNAVGVAHFYVVIALRQLLPGLTAVVACAEQQPELFPRGSELRFLDATWGDEWLRLGPV